MLIDQINLNHLRIFQAVFQTMSMTEAARQLHLTQSGVSQHIKALEDMLGTTLFDRIRQRIVPTQTAKQLYECSERSLQQIEDFLVALRAKKGQVSGTVSVGMPVEFGNNIVLPQLAKLSETHPELQFRIVQGFPSAMSEMLLNGEIDFAFVDAFGLDRQITSERIYEETLELCVSGPSGAKTIKKAENKRDFYESLNYVDYLEQSVIRATLPDAQGVARLVSEGVGAGVLPGHLAERLRRQGVELLVVPGCGTPVKNAISLSYLKSRTQSGAAHFVLETLRNRFRERQNDAPDARS
jgi:DNA-binding transcriptional LysR family regulator